MPTSPMKPSTPKLSSPKLSEVARHVVIPEGIVTTAWPRVVEQCAKMGVSFDEWQHGIGRVSLGKRADGKYAATVGGVVLSIPRQVGKTFLVGMIVIALCVLFPGLTVLWSAHRTRTATKTFGSLKGLTSRKKIAPHMLDPRNTNGEQELKFKNGSVIMFGAREQGFGRGFDEVDIEVFDEAQILTEKALEDMVPAANQSRHESGALLFFMGTPPRPTDPGEEFTNRRNKALKDKPANVAARVGGNMVYVEFSADKGSNPDDKKQWAKANPSFPLRTPVESMERMREQLTDDASFAREAMGIWDAEFKESSVISAKLWGDRKTVRPPTEGSVAYGVRFSPDGLRYAVSAALLPAHGDVHVELVEVRQMVDGTSWLIDWIVERESRSEAFVIDGKAGRDQVVNSLLARGFKSKKLMLLTTDQVIAAHSMMLESVTSGHVTHFNDEILNDSVAHAGKRPIGNAGGWGWKALKDGDVTPFESATLAHYGALIRATKKQRTGASVFR